MRLLKILVESTASPTKTHLQYSRHRTIIFHVVWHIDLSLRTRQREAQDPRYHYHTAQPTRPRHHVRILEIYGENSPSTSHNTELIIHSPNTGASIARPSFEIRSSRKRIMKQPPSIKAISSASSETYTEATRKKRKIRTAQNPK